MVKKPLTPEEEKMLLDLWERMNKKRILFFQHTLRRIRRLKKRDFVDAETFTARDKICRVFAAECFEKAQELANRAQPKEKLSLQYMKLAIKLFGLSFKPKKLEDIEAIQKAVADLKANESKEGQ
jgi:hypothetical protein